LTNPVTKRNDLVLTFEDFTGSLSNVSGPYLNLPTTATYDNLAQKGFMAAQFSGFKDLLGLDITLRARARRCPSGSFEGYAGCKGSDCYLFENVKLCSSDSDCSATTKCSNLFDLPFSEINNQPPPPAPTPPPPPCQDCSVCDCNGTSVVAENTAISAIGPVIFYSLFKPNSQCFKNVTVEVVQDFKNVFRTLQNKQRDSTYSTHFMCSYDSDVLRNKNISQWADNQVTIDAQFITLNNLLSWDVGSAPIVVKGGSGNLDHTNSGIAIFFSMIALFLSLLF